MIRKITDQVIKFQSEYLPSSYFLALFLLIVTFICAIAVGGSTPMEAIGYLANGHFELLAFTMQIVLMMVTGYALANSTIVLKFLKKLCGIPKTKNGCIIFVAIVSYIACYIHWAFGTVVGALVAKEIGIMHRGKKVHYPILVASAYAGFLARGLSSAVFISPSTAGHIAEKFVGVLPITDTLYSIPNIILTIAMCVTIPFLFKAMQPDEKDVIELPPGMEVAEIEAEVFDKSKFTFSERLDHNPITTIAIALVILFYTLYSIFTSGTFNISLNSIILLFLALGMLAQKTPYAYSKAVASSCKTSGGMILQYPVYAAIYVLLRDSGLAQMISDFFINVSSAVTLPFYSFLSAAVINFFVPSGGGLWTLQGPIFLEAAAKLGADAGAVVVGMGYGDCWTTLIQPFWALPLLSIAGLDVKDIMGYCSLILVWSGILISGCIFYMAIF